MKISWIKYLIVGIILTIIIFYSSIAIYNFVVNNVPLMDTEKCLSYEPVSGFNNLSDYSLKPSPATIAEASASIRQFSGSSGNVQYMSTTLPRPQVILYQFDTEDGTFWVDNITGRVQLAVWHEPRSKDKRETIDLDQGCTIAESFAREKYPEFWNTSDTRGTRIITKNVLDSGIDRQLRYGWGVVYYNSDKVATPHAEIPGLNSVFVTVSPYTGHVIQYAEDYTPSVITGVSPVNLTPALTEVQAETIAEQQFRTFGGSGISLAGPQSLGLKILTDNNNTPHLTWCFKMTRIQMFGEKYAYVDVDAHDGTIVGKYPFEC